MSPRSRKEYIEVTSLRYKEASRKRKTAILDEFCATCQCHRKHAIRILRSFRRFIKPKIKKRGRTFLYPKESILKPLKQIWRAANPPCSKRLKAILPLWLPGYVQLFGPLPLPVVHSLLKTASPNNLNCLILLCQEGPWRINLIESSNPSPNAPPPTILSGNILF